MKNILFNDKCEVVIDSLGAELKSFFDKGNKYIVFEKTENEKSYTFNLENGLTTNNKIEIL